MRATARLLYRLLIAVMPAEFRSRYASEALAMFDGRLRAVRGRAALRCAVRELSDLGRAIVRERRGTFAGVGLDVKTAFAACRHRPGVTIAVVMTLAFGIGTATAVSSVVSGILLRPLPFHDPDRLVAIWEIQHSSGLAKMSAAPPNVADWRAARDVLDDVGVFTSGDAVLRLDQDAAGISVARVSPNMFSLLGAVPLAGRLFTEEDAGPEILISERLWRERFGADPGLVGRTIRIGFTPHLVVGIMPARFSFPPPIAFEDVGRPPPADAYLRLAWRDMAQTRGAHYVTAIGRLATGVPMDVAEERLRAIAADLAVRHPGTNTGWGVMLAPLDAEIVAQSRPALLIVFAAVAVVLLLACSNVAHLLFARALDRRRELAVRVALGATRGRLARQLAVEGVLAAGAAAILAMILAGWSVPAIVRLAPGSIPRLDEIRIDSTMLAIGIAVTTLAAVLSNLAPIVRVVRTASAEGLHDRSGAGSPGARATQRVIVGLDAGLSVALVVVAVLAAQSFLRLRSVDLGFQPEQLTMFHVQVGGDRYRTSAQRTTFVEQLLDRLRAVPGVVNAGTIDAAPIADGRQGTSFDVEGAPPFRAGEEPTIRFAFVSPGYFETAGIRVVQGRTFTAADRDGAEPVVIVNDSFARRFFAEGGAVDRRVSLGFNQQVVRRIVGVVADDRHESPATPPEPTAYTPVFQFQWSRYAVLVRSGAGAGGLGSALRSSVQAIDPALAVYDVTPMASIVSESLSAWRFSAALVGSFAAAALLLSLVGVYGVANQSVVSRRAEVGVRLALGASPGGLARAVVRQTVTAAAVGLAGGLLVVAASRRAIDAMLVDVSATEPVAHAAGAAAVLATTALAAFLPVRRMLRSNPLDALRRPA